MMEELPEQAPIPEPVPAVTLKLPSKRKILANKNRPRKVNYKIYKSKSCHPATEQTEVPGALAGPTMHTSLPQIGNYPSNDVVSGGGMVKVLEHLNLSTVKLQAELETTRCQLAVTTRKIETTALSSSNDDDEKLDNIMTKTLSMESSVKTMEQEMIHVKTLLQLQLNCLHGILNLLFNTPQQAQPRHISAPTLDVETSNATISEVPEASLSSQEQLEQDQEALAGPARFQVQPGNSARTSEQLKCNICKRIFLTRRNFDKHCQSSPPKYCAKRRIKVEAHQDPAESVVE